MTVTAVPSRTEPGRSSFTARNALILIVLMWAAQLLGLVGLLSGNVQAEIAVHFRTARISWFTLITGLVGTFATPFAIKAAAMYGKKRVMVVITVLGLVGDLIAALATNYSMLLIGRGVAGCYGPIGALAYSMVRDVLPRRLIGPASGLLGGGVGLVALGGPFLSAWLVDGSGFRGALWFMAAASALSLAALVVLVPESPVREERTRIDWLGGLLLGGGLTAVVYGIGEGAGWGWTSARTLFFIGGGLAAVVGFVFTESRVPNPMIPLPLLRRRPVWTMLLTTSLVGGAAYAVGTVMFLLALMPTIPGVSDGLGFSATRNALIGAPSSVLILTGAVAAGTLARRFDAWFLLAAGGLLVAGGYGLISVYHHTVPQLMLLGAVTAVGMGLVVATIPILVIQAVHPAEQALANGAQSMAQGVTQTVLSQLAFIILARDSQVVHGIRFYRDAGYSNGLLLTAGVAATGTALALILPKRHAAREL
ncbi:MFS transporter [Frankia sp. Mgl5]|uniref:MFS transporter n=1 Tax=Frankia sp. Mgl5 TaxID=2933793 RepID=UPI0020104EF2|nr:MFS transporter [Frankia sp. Mgl5]MCK9928901.1 MFS transporter [Frankia sp. Mgl5]